MKGHNICLYSKIRKIVPKLSLLPLFLFRALNSIEIIGLYPETSKDPPYLSAPRTTTLTGFSDTCGGTNVQQAEGEVSQ